MTILYEPVCHGAEHAPFNAALLATTLEAYPRGAVVFFSEPGHAEEVRALLDRASADAIAWRTLTIAPRASRDLRTRLPCEWRAVTEVLTTAEREKATRVVACAVTHIGLASLHCQLLARAPLARVAVVHHSGLASTLGSRSTQRLIQWTAGGQIRHVVLGKSIHQAVTEHLPRAIGVRSMRHPYLFADVAGSVWPGDEPIRFGFLGLASADKGFDRFCRVATRVSRASAGIAVRPRFELVGRLDGASRAALSTLDADNAVEIGSQDGPMPRSLFDARAGAMTYAVLPYRSSHALASSGAILDAFAHGTPCIALRTPLFSEYFSTMGDIGYLCRDEAELTSVVSSIVATRPAERWATQRRNIIERRVIFKPKNVARELRQVLS